jgi:hypothetical protein
MAVSFAMGFIWLAQAAQPQEMIQPVWKFSLEPYGYKAGPGYVISFTRLGGVAAANEVVAAAVARDHPGGAKAPLERTYDVSVVLLNSKTGHFLTKLGPWVSSSGFRLVATNGGRLLLLLRHSDPSTRSSSGEFRLFSSSGEEVGRLELLSLKTSLISPSRKTVMLAELRDNEIHFQVLDADTLEMRSEWKEEVNKESPSVIGISDEEMLGSASSKQFFVRNFRSSWRPVALPRCKKSRQPQWFLWWGSPQFLRDDVLVNSACETENEAVLFVTSSDGTILSQHAIPRLRDRNYALRAIVVSQDGRYFAHGLMHENAFTYWWDHTIDMWPLGAQYFLYVWNSKVKATVARVRLGGIAQSICFLPDASGVVIVDGTNVELIRLPPSVPSASCN